MLLEKQEQLIMQNKNIVERLKVKKELSLKTVFLFSLEEAFNKSNIIIRDTLANSKKI